MIRTCVGCGAKRKKDELIRIVKPNGLKIDLKQREPGRAVYLCPKLKCLKIALKRKAITRGLKTPIKEKEKELLINFFEENYGN